MVTETGRFVGLLTRDNVTDVLLVQRLRRGQLTKVPGVAETIDWAAALLALGAGRLTPELVDETLGVVLKYEEDVRAIRGATARVYLEETAVGAA